MNRVKELTNTSDQPLVVEHPDGVVSNVPPGGTLRNTRVTNLAEVQRQASVTHDLGEIKEQGSGQGRTQLRD